MIDATTSDVKKLELYVAFGKRIGKVVADARETLDREVDTLKAQLARVTDHETSKP